MDFFTITTAKIIVYLVVFILLNIGSYFFVREMIWSIVWCDKKDKKNITVAKLKMGSSFIEQIRMTCLFKHLRDYKKEFSFWLMVKTIFIICEVTFIILYLVFSIAKLKWWGVVSLITLAQSFIWLLAFAFQFRHGFLTKYDVIRENYKK